MTVTARERLQRLEALFHAALALPPGERDAYLLDECTGDDALRLEVQALLAADAQDARHDVSGAIGKVAHAVSAEGIPPAGNARRIGAWRLERPLGAGGMGTVHLAARADGAFEARAALKLLNPWLVGSGFEERFARERQFLADLKHPNIAGLLDGGITDDGVPYLVVEFIDGETVSNWAAAHKPDLRARLALFVEICEAVQHAHQNLVVHRDLKPGNILVASDGHAKLLDFGIAKLVPATVGADAGATREGSRLMTPEYASPEQLRGEPATTASDVYSLGLILYELVAGGRPNRPPDSAHDTALPTRPSTWIARTRDPVELPQVERRRWARNLRGDLDTIVLKALAFDPPRRYQTARELADDVRRFLTHEPIRARPDSWAYRFGLLLQRRPLASALAAAFIVAVVGSAIGFAALSVRLRDERDRAAELQARAEQAAKTAERTSAFLASLFQSSDPRNRGGGLTGRELLDAGARRLETELADEPDTLAYLSFVIGGIQRQLGLLDDAVKSLRRSVDIRTRRFGRNSKETADSLSELADTLRMQAKWQESEALQRESLAIRENLDPPDPKGLGQSLNNLALVIKESGRLQESLEMTKRAVEVRRASLGDDAPVTIISLVNLGMLERDLGMYQDAERDLEEVVERRLRLFGEEHFSTSNGLTNLARLRLDQGRYAEAESLYRRALAAMRATAGESHSGTADCLADVGRILEWEGKNEEAERFYRESIAVEQRVGQDQNAGISSTNAHLGRLLARTGRASEGEPLMREALATLRRVLGPHHPRVARVEYDLGSWLTDAGRADEGLPFLEAALATRETAYPPGHVDTGWTRLAIAKAQAALGRTDQAAKSRALAVAALDRVLPPDHPQRARLAEQ